jgi:protein-tyrosine sulfotransferase
MSEPINIALIIGCARSGTSILGELIASHPEVKYVFEAHDVWELAGQGAYDSHRLVAEHATPEIRKRIREWFRKRQGSATLVVEKTPRNVLRVPFIRAIFPEAKIIHIIRDGRDVACSLMPGIGGDEWRHLKPPSWQKLFSDYTGIQRCALAWKEIIEIALEDLSPVPHHQVRYEQLATRPQEVSRDVLRYVGLADDPRVEKFCHKIQDSTPGSYHAQYQAQWYRDDHKSRIGRWRENLSNTEQEMVTGLLGNLLSGLGYE